MNYNKSEKIKEKQAKKKEEKKDNIKEPINYNEIIEDFFRTPKYEKRYIKPLINEILSRDLVFYDPELRIELKDLDNEFIKLFRKEPDAFIRHIREGLYNRLSFAPNVQELFKRYEKESKDLHIIPNPVDYENLVPKIRDLSRNRTKFKNLFTIFEGRYLNLGIDKRPGFNSITFRCTSCTREFKKFYLNNIDDRIKKPNFCTNSKCKNKDFQKIDSDSFEIGYFKIGDLDFKRSGNDISCIILDNIDNFIEKVKTINLGEDIEVLGIVRLSYFALESGGNKRQNFEYYLEVFDIKPKKTKNLDESIIKTLKNKLKNPSYSDKLIDSIHPLTYLIDIYFPTKMLNVMAYTTGGSWNKRVHIRDTLNCIIIGPPSTYKSRIAEALEFIIGKRHFMVFECNEKMTSAGIIGTTQRDPDRITPTVRYGILILYSDGTIVFDEGHKMPLIILDILRCLEKGNVGALQDVVFDGPTYESLVIMQNCVINDDGSFKKDETIFKNLGWDDKHSRSRLERFDLLHVIPIPDTFIKIRTLDNEERISKGILLDEIANDLELDDYDFPKSTNTIESKIQYLLYNYFHRAKEIYSEIHLSEEDKGPLRQIYREAMFDKKDKYKTDTDVNIRSLNICYKTLKSLSALRFSKKVDKSIFTYFKQKCMRLIIPFRDSLLIETKSINMDEIFKDTFRNIIKDEITTKEFIDEIRKYVKRIYYNDKPDEVFEEEIKDYIGIGYSFEENYTFKKLLENNEGWLNEQGFFKVSGKGKGKLTSIERKEKRNLNYNPETIRGFPIEKIELSNEECIKREKEIVERIEEIFEENKFNALEEKSLRQRLELDFSKELIEEAFDYLRDIERIIPDENNDKLIYFKKS